MERFSWQVHFRNRYIIRRDWHSIPVSGTIEGGLVSPVFCWKAVVSLTGRRSCGAEFKPITHAPFWSNSALATGGALRPALPGRAWARHRANVDSAKETGARFRGRQPRRQSIPPAGTRPASALQPRPRLALQVTRLPLTARLTRRLTHRRRARTPTARRAPSRSRRSAASRRLTPIAPGKFRSAHPRALHARRAHRNVGRRHAGRDAALSGRSGMAVEDNSRFPSADQTRIRPQPRSPAQSGKRNDTHARRGRSKDGGETDSSG